MAASFMARGFPTVVIPMYDGSSNHTNEHWYLLRETRIVNFSFSLHLKCESLGNESFYGRYFSDPSQYQQVSFAEGLRGFFWQRRPDHINWRDLTNHVVKSQLTHLHIHDAPDLPELKGIIPHQSLQERQSIAVTTWFENKSDLNKVLDNSNVFFAPRITEGIGQSFIEAMNRGMFIIANHLPTHCEYLANWINGVLLDWNQPCYVDMNDLSRIENIGKRARETAFAGHQKWLKTSKSMQDFVLSTKRTTKHYSKKQIAEFDKMPEVFFKGSGYNKFVKSLY
jgi:hypothetical protein